MTGIEAYNTSRLNVRVILADPGQVAGNLRAWTAAFDADTRHVIEKFDFDVQIGRLDRARLLYRVLSKVTEVDFHPDKVSNVEMNHFRDAEGRTTNEGRRTDDFAFRRRKGWKPVSRLPARPSSSNGAGSESKRRDPRDRLLSAAGQLHSPAANGSRSDADGHHSHGFRFSLQQTLQIAGVG